MNTATARKLSPKVESTPKKKSRTPLAIVKYVPTQRLPKIPLPILCAGIFAVALMILLIMNIAISSAQYELASLKSTSNAIAVENQELNEQLQAAEAPQNLASAAIKLGMVTNQSTAVIDVNTLTVTGTAKAAVEGDNKGALIPAPEINTHYMMAPPEIVAPSAPTEVAPEAGVEGESEKPVVTEESTSVTEEEPVVEFTQELNGGSVPAPAQRTPGT